MYQPDSGRPAADPPAAKPSKSRLGRILADRPEARPRLARAVGGLLAVVLVTVAAIGALLIWHLRRRAGLIRARLAPGRRPGCSELELTEPDDDGPKPPPSDPRRPREEPHP